MQNRKQLDRDIKLINTFKGLAEAYEEISVTKMQRVRGKVLSAREFLEELSKVFDDVKSSYGTQIEQLLKHKKGIFSFSTFNKNGKSVSVLISSNNKLYGDIGRKVFRVFMDQVKGTQGDIFIIGKVGKEFFENSGENKKFGYMDFPENESEQQELSKLLGSLSTYESVHVFYGQFVNVLTQNPVVTNVSGTESLKNNKLEEKRQVRFFFEPSLEAVLSIFENQIFGSLFRQTLHESELSHVTSRIRQMEYALENIEDSQKKLYKKRKLVIKRQESAKRLQRLAGISLWR
mgnify:CR=1 FL=1